MAGIFAEMRKKGINLYLNLIGASLGLSIFLKSTWCFINATHYIGNATSKHFWNYFFAELQFMSLTTLLLWGAMFVILLITS